MKTGLYSASLFLCWCSLCFPERDVYAIHTSVRPAISYYTGESCQELIDEDAVSVVSIFTIRGLYGISDDKLRK